LTTLGDDVGGARTESLGVVRVGVRWWLTKASGTAPGTSTSPWSRGDAGIPPQEVDRELLPPRALPSSLLPAQAPALLAAPLPEIDALSLDSSAPTTANGAGASSPVVAAVGELTGASADGATCRDGIPTRSERGRLRSRGAAWTRSFVPVAGGGGGGEDGGGAKQSGCRLSASRAADGSGGGGGGGGAASVGASMRCADPSGCGVAAVLPGSNREGGDRLLDIGEAAAAIAGGTSGETQTGSMEGAAAGPARGVDTSAERVVTLSMSIAVGDVMLGVPALRARTLFATATTDETSCPRKPVPSAKALDLGRVLAEGPNPGAAALLAARRAMVAECAASRCPNKEWRGLTKVERSKALRALRRRRSDAPSELSSLTSPLVCVERLVGSERASLPSSSPSEPTSLRSSSSAVPSVELPPRDVAVLLVVGRLPPAAASGGSARRGLPPGNGDITALPSNSLLSAHSRCTGGARCKRSEVALKLRPTAPAEDAAALALPAAHSLQGAATTAVPAADEQIVSRGAATSNSASASAAWAAACRRETGGDNARPVDDGPDIIVDGLTGVGGLGGVAVATWSGTAGDDGTRGPAVGSGAAAAGEGAIEVLVVAGAVTAVGAVGTGEDGNARALEARAVAAAASAAATTSARCTMRGEELRGCGFGGSDVWCVRRGARGGAWAPSWRRRRARACSWARRRWKRRGRGCW